METNAQIRLNKAYDYLKFKKIIKVQKDVAERMGATRPNVSNALSGKEEYLTNSFLKRFGDAFSNTISTKWLLTGEGEMLRTDAPDVVSVSEDTPPPQLIPAPPGKGLPLIPLPAMAGFLKGAADIDPNEIEWYFVPAFRDCQFLIRVKGESMSPRYLSGDIVACREVQDTGTFFQWGKTYVLDTDQGVVIKRVRPSEKENHVLCVSDNPEYDPFDVPTASIYHLAIVRGLIREE